MRDFIGTLLACVGLVVLVRRVLAFRLQHLRTEADGRVLLLGLIGIASSVFVIVVSLQYMTDNKGDYVAIVGLLGLVIGAAVAYRSGAVVLLQAVSILLKAFSKDSDEH